jgi:hypothetical protein
MRSTGPVQAGRPGTMAARSQADLSIEPTVAELGAAATVLRMIWGTHISRAVYAAARLGVADRLAHGPVSCAELARDTGTDEPSLYRVLRLLAGLGLLCELPPRSFALTILGHRLRTDAPASMRSWALMFGSEAFTKPFEHIMYSIRTGEPGFEAAHGVPLFEFVSNHPADAAAFDSAMLERTAAFAASMAGGYDFADIRTIVDVGGGRGILLATILAGHAHLQGKLFELPTVAAEAHALMAGAGVADRCEVVAGDFFRGVPQGADCYVLANVLHDWDDTTAIGILTSCRRAVTSRGRVLVAERLIPDDLAEAVPALLSDINMLVLAGGRERTDAEYGRLFEAAGLRLGVIRPIAFPYGIIEGIPAG